MVLPKQIEDWIKEGLPGAEVTVSGDGHHFEAVITYRGFENKSILSQHRMVYNSLGNKMENAIHALSIKTFVPT
jgi:acid stress-induced BolA-like protein IbaG/YrbA